MVHNRSRVLEGIHLRNVLGDKFSVRIESFCLTGGVEDPEVGLGISARARGPLPAPIVGGKIPVKKLLHEVTLAPLPGDQKVLGEERGDDHAQAVVHPAGLVELPHGRIHDRKAGLPLAPRGKEILPVFPLDRVIFPAERALGDVRKLPKDLLVEVAPGQLRDKNINLFLGRRILGPGPARGGQNGPDGNCSETQVGGKTGGGIRMGKVPHGVIPPEVFGDKVPQQLLGDFFPRRRHRNIAGIQSQLPKIGEGDSLGLVHAGKLGRARQRIVGRNGQRGPREGSKDGVRPACRSFDPAWRLDH